MGRPSKPLDPSSSQEARLGAAIRHRREQRGITQEQLAEAIGFSRPHIALVELGRAHASEELVRRCDEVLEADGSVLVIYPEVVAERERRQQEAARLRSRPAPRPLPASGRERDRERDADEERAPGRRPDRAQLAAFFGSSRRVVITIPLRTLRTGRLVIAYEDVEAAETLARFIRGAGIDTRLRYVDPSGELDFSPAGLVVICGTKSSPVIAGLVEKHDPLYACRPDEHGRVWIIERDTENRLGSPMDLGYPANQDICYFARLPRPGTDRPFLSIGGIHAAGSLGAVHYLTNPQRFHDLYQAVEANRFTMVISSAFTRAPLRILSSEALTAPRLHPRDLGCHHDAGRA
ncbi:MAG TPA: helix-turn-helix transcriptional regulator [Actinomycetota bacterium]